MNIVRLGLSTAISSALLLSSSANAAPPRPGDYLVASRTHGWIISVDPRTGIAGTVLTGPDAFDPADPPALIGAGPDLGPSFRLSIDSATGGAILARTCLNPAKTWGLFDVDAFNGDRTRLPGSESTLWDECGDIIFNDTDTIYATASGDYETSPDDRGRVIHFDLNTHASTLISGDARGDGLGMISPRALARLDASTLLVLEVNIPTGVGAGLFKIDLVSGDRTLLSWITRGARERRMIVNGADTCPVTIGDDEGGAGPQVNRQTRAVCVTPDGRILVGAASEFGSFFAGAILEIDPETGDRTLLLGDAIDQNTGQHLIVPPSNDPDFGRLQAPMGLLNTPGGRVAFTELFGAGRLLELDPATGALAVVADIPAQIAATNSQLSGLAIYWPDYNPGDLAPPFGVFNFDDVLAFLVAFGAMDPIADSAPPLGTFNFDDVLAFLTAFTEG
ncbi:MAG: hypothetical protein ACIARR_11370 [Phycisphaerales bacterium JB059]